MDMHPRNEYLKAVTEKDFKAKTKEKSQILDEYCEHQATKRLCYQEKTHEEELMPQETDRGLFTEDMDRAAIAEGRSFLS